MWYTILQYLEEDPLPDSVRDLFLDGKQFDRAWPVWIEFNKFGHNSDLGPENYNARYYPKAELEGWPDMVNYIFRTVMIYMDRLEGITKETRKSVSDSIPKGRGEPLEIAKKFAMWAAWKRGGEDIPEWAHPGAVLPSRPDENEKRLSDAQFKKLQRAAAIPAPERQSARLRSANGIQQSESGTPTSTPKTSTLGPRRTACDACRKRKMRCKHLEPAATANGVSTVTISTPSSVPPQSSLLGAVAISPTAPVIAPPLLPQTEIQTPPKNPVESVIVANSTKQQPETPDGKKGRNKACQECRRSKVSRPHRE
jgi:F-box/leucine-rich repeat protein 10/11